MLVGVARTSQRQAADQQGDQPLRRDAATHDPAQPGGGVVNAMHGVRVVITAPWGWLAQEEWFRVTPNAGNQVAEDSAFDVSGCRERIRMLIAGEQAMTQRGERIADAFVGILDDQGRSLGQGWLSRSICPCPHRSIQPVWTRQNPAGAGRC